MLIEFAVTNFRSFKERQVFSLLPSSNKDRRIAPLKIDNYPKLRILPSAVFYGANNAGKSNFLRAISALKWVVRNSGSFNSDKKLEKYESFSFDTQTQNQPITFEIDFIAPNQKRYSYTVMCTESVIVQENLYVYNVSETGKVTVKTLYERNRQSIKFTALKGVRESINFEPNQLFLSRGDIEGNKELKEVYSFFSNHLFVHQLTETEYTDFLTKMYANFLFQNKEEEMQKVIEKILHETQTGILGIESSLVDMSKFPFPEDIAQELKDKIFEQLKFELRTRHKLFNGLVEIGEKTVSLKEESTGTRKLLGLSPIILNALEDGDTLIIDEMNTSMHTEITSWLIDLFNNTETNPNNAQLIITAHDMVLLHRDLYDRDQIFVVEKNKFGASEMYSFADITGLRPNNKLSDYYETGRLGGVPHISKPYLQHVISQFLKDAKAKTEQK
jgi:AAA15 family ATPase/GTPase